MPIKLCEFPHEKVVPGLKLLNWRGRKGVVAEKQYSGPAVEALEQDVFRNGPNDPLVFILWEGDTHRFPASWWLSGLTTVNVVETNENN